MCVWIDHHLLRQDSVEYFSHFYHKIFGIWKFYYYYITILCTIFSRGSAAYQVWYLTSISYKNNKTWTCLISSIFVLKIIQIIYSVFMYLFIYTPQRVLLNCITILNLLAVSIIIKHASIEKTFLSYYFLFYIRISIYWKIDEITWQTYETLWLLLYNLIINAIQLTLRLSGLKITEQVVYW